MKMKANEMGGICGMNGSEEKCKEYFGEKA
jgi:hypothetical protein